MWTRRCSETRGFARLAAMPSSETQLQDTAKVPGHFVECRSPGRIAVMTAFVDRRLAPHRGEDRFRPRLGGCRQPQNFALKKNGLRRLSLSDLQGVCCTSFSYYQRPSMAHARLRFYTSSGLHKSILRTFVRCTHKRTE